MDELAAAALLVWLTAWDVWDDGALTPKSALAGVVGAVWGTLGGGPAGAALETDTELIIEGVLYQTISDLTLF